MGDGHGRVTFDDRLRQCACPGGRRLVETGKEIAAEMLEAAQTDISYDTASYSIAGTDRRVSLFDVAARAIEAGAAPERGLEVENRYNPTAATYPNGCHIAEVEVDPETGVVTLENYVMAQDVGRALNPMVVEGQLVGGVAQGVGQALLEWTVKDPDSGQLLTGSFMDCMPRADDLPAFSTAILEIPCANTPTGVKSVGEAGPTGAPAAVINAIVDALRPLGVRHLEMPATPQAVWKAIQRGIGNLRRNDETDYLPNNPRNQFPRAAKNSENPRLPVVRLPACLPL